MIRKLGILFVGVASVFPLILIMAVMFVLLSPPARFPERTFTILIASCLLLSLPCFAYLIYRIVQSGESELNKRAWITALFVSAPLAAPAAWYRFCFRSLKSNGDADVMR